MTKINTKPNPTEFSALLIPGILAITLYFHVQAYDPFNTPKFVILIILASWLTGPIINFFRKNELNVKKKSYWILSISLFFITSLTFSLFSSTNLLKALIGESQRRNGYLSYLSLVVVMLYLAIFTKIDGVVKLLKLAIVTGLIMSTYGIFQVFGRDFVHWDNPYNSMISTTGNPNFASALLAILAVISILVAKSAIFHKYYRIAGFIMFSSGLFAIYQSNSRQGLLVIFFGTIFYILLVSWLKFKRLRYSIFSVLVFTTALVVIGMLNQGPLASYLYKPSVSVRGYYWRAALKMFENFPLSGVGLDDYGSYFKEFREIGYPLKHGFEITSTNAHNTFLQFFATGGFFVGISYLTILVFVFFVGIRNIKSNSDQNRELALILLSSWVSFQSQSLISIDNIAISMWGWILSGLILSQYISKELLNSKSHGLNKNANRGNNINVFQNFISALLLVPTLVVSVMLSRSETSSLLIKSLSYSDNETSRNSQKNYSFQLFQNPLADSTYKLDAAIRLVGSGFIREGVEEILILHSKEPRNLDILRWLAIYENQIGNYQKAIYYRKEIVRYDPWNLENYLELGILEKNYGSLDNSFRIKNLILSLAPSSEVAKMALERLT